jgi:hypothetical protein
MPETYRGDARGVDLRADHAAAADKIAQDALVVGRLRQGHDARCRHQIMDRADRRPDADGGRKILGCVTIYPYSPGNFDRGRNDKMPFPLP